MPSFSSAAMRLPSLKRAGGVVRCAVTSKPVASTRWPSANAGIGGSSLPPAGSTRRNPGTSMTVPEAVKRQVSALPCVSTSKVTVVVVPVASTICEATVRRHTRSYSRSAFVPSPFALRREKSTGRIASWASWALRTLLLIGRAFAGTLSGPNIDTAALRAATIACGAMCGLSVRG